MAILNGLLMVDEFLGGILGREKLCMKTMSSLL